MMGTRAMGLWVTLFVTGCGVVDEELGRVSRGNAAALQVETAPAEPDTALGAALSATFRGAVQRALPAIVHVSVERDAPPTPPDLALPEYFRRFFDLPDDPLELPPEESTGTGFVYDRSGLVLTSGHVVEGASGVRVRLRDGRELVADVMGVDPATDVAVLKLRDETGLLATVDLGDSERLRVGDWVLALGNPLGLDFTVTAGIVSAKGRQLAGGGTTLEAYIQTDAAINPGNSGGPLIDLSGRVVGINAAIYGATRYVGYGFAVPIDLARRVADDLLEYGHVRRPRLGIRVSDVTAVDAEVYGLRRVTGAEVNGVEADSPGERAGLKPGDVVLELDGDSIQDATRLTTMLAQRLPGDEIVLGVFRGGERLTLRATLGEFPTSGAEPTPGAEVDPSTVEDRLGFRVEPLTAALAERLGLPEGEVGRLVVTDVASFASARRAGVRIGQRLLEVEGTAVRSVADVDAIAEELRPGEAVSVRVLDPELGETVINFRVGSMR